MIVNIIDYFDLSAVNGYSAYGVLSQIPLIKTH